GATEWIVDPLAVDVLPMGDLFSDPSVRKLLHDAEYDVRQLKADYGFTFQGIFDTRAACAVLGVQAPGLASQLEQHFGVQSTGKKKYQRADWTRRPIPEGQLAYAQLDVAYLHPLAELLEEEIHTKGRMPVLMTEHTRLQALEASEDPYTDDSWARIKRAAKLDPQARRRLRQLYLARNAAAKAANLAPFRVMGDTALVNIAERPPNNLKEMTRLDGITWKTARRMGDALLQALEDARSMDPIKRMPRRRSGPYLDEAAQDRYDALRSWRASTSRKEEMDSSLILRRELMEQIAADSPSNHEELERYLAPWQIERYADAMMRALEKAGSSGS
ncbi:MAG: HRDC domain-containing protein, partial [Myxococcota bacterium]|nr:HRDC domain-containing protein [Myxococcota bacterium]